MLRISIGSSGIRSDRAAGDMSELPCHCNRWQERQNEERNDHAIILFVRSNTPKSEGKYHTRKASVRSIQIGQQRHVQRGPQKLSGKYNQRVEPTHSPGHLIPRHPAASRTPTCWKSDTSTTWRWTSELPVSESTRSLASSPRAWFLQSM